jgi:hypothetical protein
MAVIEALRSRSWRLTITAISTKGAQAGRVVADGG